MTQGVTLGLIIGDLHSHFCDEIFVYMEVGHASRVLKENLYSTHNTFWDHSDSRNSAAKHYFWLL